MILVDIILLILLYFFYFYKKWKEKDKNILFLNTIVYIYLCCVIYITLMPFVDGILHIFDHPYNSMNLSPFIDVIEGWGDYKRQIVLNIIMTIPYGILIPLVLKNKKFLAIKTIGSCFIFSLLIEIIQPLLSGLRSSDITDIITNTIGGIIGYLIYKITKPLLYKIFQIK